MPPRTITSVAPFANACCTRMNDVASPTRPPASWPFTIRPSAAIGPARRSSQRVASIRTDNPAARIAATASGAASAAGAPSTISVRPFGPQRPARSVAVPASSSATPKPPSVASASVQSPASSLLPSSSSASGSSAFRIPMCPARTAAMASAGSPVIAGVITRTLKASVIALSVPGAPCPARYSLNSPIPYIRQSAAHPPSVRPSCASPPPESRGQCDRSDAVFP